MKNINVIIYILCMCPGLHPIHDLLTIDTKIMYVVVRVKGEESIYPLIVLNCKDLSAFHVFYG